LSNSIEEILQKDPDTLSQDELNTLFLYLHETTSTNIAHKSEAIKVINQRLQEQHQVNATHEKAIGELQMAIIELRNQLDVIKGAENALMSSGGIILG